jgi:hypothetical protein
LISKIFFLFLFVFQVQASEIEGFFGGQYTQYQKISTDYDQYGVSARFKYNRYQSGRGLTALTMWNGHSVIAGDFMLGYGFRAGKSLYLEAAGYGAFSIIWGPGFALLGSLGFELGESYFLNIPLIMRFPAYLGIAPMFGIRF